MNQFLATNINPLKYCILSSFRFQKQQIRMRSFSPQIIKHYIPLEFSKEVVDYQPPPLKAIPPSEDNPLTNMVLRNLDKRHKREFVLTFTNKSHTQFKPKKQLTYRNLFQQLEGGQQKLQLMKKELLNYQEKEDYAKRRANIFQKEKINSKTREISSSKQHRGHNKSSGESRNISSAKSTNLNPQKRLTRRIFSSRNFRQAKNVIRDQYPMTPKTAWTRNDYDVFAQSNSGKDFNTLRIKGSKAPDAQMVDHWKKSTVDASSVFVRSSR